MELNEQFANVMSQPLKTVWNAIAWDLPMDAMNNREAIKACIDADRLETFHSKDANDLLKTAIAEHGYAAVMELLDTYVGLN